MTIKALPCFYEELVHVPLIIKYPGQKKGKIVDANVSHVDLMPTLLEMTNQAIPKQAQGISLAACLNDQNNNCETRDYAFSEWCNLNREHTRTVDPEAPRNYMVRGQGWKYIIHADGEEILYYLTNDPDETCNPTSDPEKTEIKNHLKGDCSMKTGTYWHVLCDNRPLKAF